MKRIAQRLVRALLYGALFQLLIGLRAMGAGMAAGFLAALALPPAAESGMLQIDFYAYRSALRGVSAIVKLGLCLLCLLLCLLSHSPLFHLLLLLSQAALTLWRGRIPARAYLHFLELPVVFILLGAAGIMLRTELHPLRLSVTPESFAQARMLSLRALSAVSCLYSLNLSTPLSQLLLALRRLHVPKIITELMYMMYRYIFLLFAMYAPMKKAYTMKLADLRASSAIRGSGMLWSALLRRSYARAQMSYLAMSSRAYEGEIAFLAPPGRAGAGAAFLAGCAAALIAGFFALGGWR